MNEIVTACHKLYDRQLVSNHDGNITFRCDEGFIATPTSFSKGEVTEDDLLVLDSEGHVTRGRHKVFSEIAVHLLIYQLRPDVKCIVHAHPPTASGFGLSDNEIGTPSIPEAIVSLGRGIFTAQNSSREELSRVLAESDGFVIRGNGGWTVGQGVMQTYYRMELVEHVARQHLTALQLGGLLAKRPPRKSILDSDRRLRKLVEEEVRSIFSREE
jgi:L-fuculose-phosphate aldolase